MIPFKRCTDAAPFMGLLATFCALLLWPSSAPAQTAPDSKTPYVFLDCDNCDVSYIRVEIPFVNWVRDREDAVVHVLITSQRTGSGGREYSLDFIGLKTHAGTDQTLSYVAPPDYTDDEEREGMAGILKVGLLPYLQSPLLRQLSVTFAGEQAAAPTTPASDPWDSWVFEIEAGGDIERQASRTELAMEASFSADRVTEIWRIRSYSDFEYEEDRFESGGTSSTSSSHEWLVWGMLAHSLGPHWSVGGFAR